MRSIQMRTDQIRDAIVKTTRMLAKDGIKVTQIGAQAYCNFDKRTGKATSINLPVIPDEPTEEFLAALQGFLDHEVAHFYLTKASEYGGTKTITDQNGGERNVDVTGMTNIVEDVRIERTFVKMFPGAALNLNNTLVFMIDKYWGKWLGQVNASALDPAEKEKRTRTLAMVPFMRARGGQKVCADWLTANNIWPLYQPLDDRIPDLEQRLAAMQSTADATELAKLIIEALYPPPKPKKEAKGEPDEQTLGQANGGTGKEPEPKGKGGKPQDLDDIDMGAPGQTDETPPEAPPSKPEKGEQPAPEPSNEKDEGEGASGKEEGDVGGEKEDPAGDKDGGEGPVVEGEGDAGDKEGDKDDKPGKDGKQNTPLKEAMKSLSPEQRRALFLYNKKKQSVAEIASKLGKSASATQILLGKARRALSKAMKRKG